MLGRQVRLAAAKGRALTRACASGDGAGTVQRGALRPGGKSPSPSMRTAPAEEDDAAPSSPPLGPQSVVEALRDSSSRLGFGFSAGGLLFPYYIGVVGKLTSLRIMTPDTPVAGASAGSLIAACHHAGLTEQQVTEACWVLCDNCRRNGTRGRLGRVLERFLHDLLPEDVHERCSDRTFVAVTQLWPRPRGKLISSFESKEDLIACLLTSCHIPWWFDGGIARTFRGSMHYDGGLTNFIPVPPETVGVRVCCFPASAIRSVGYRIGISPPLGQHDMSQLLQWAFNPAAEETLESLVHQGRVDAEAWANSSGALAAVLGEPHRLAAPESDFAKQGAGSNGAGLVADGGEATEKGGLVRSLASRLLGR
ncbi:hypothetical protein WJX81_003246 [Elliptochloris bilobata]|uniref:Patatin n=1 Tax=Elliptochloris bilobata TaxID=381761 RepID=A0AAW1S7E2_9CHLO